MEGTRREGAGYAGLPDTWYLYDGGRHHGPLSWGGVCQKVMAKGVSRRAFVKNETWVQWVPLTYYFYPQQLRDPEVMGFIPSRYDAMFYAGMGLFILGFLVLVTYWVVAIFMFLASTFIEIYAIVLERRNRPSSVASALGNIMAGFWILIQIGVIFLFMVFLLRSL